MPSQKPRKTKPRRESVTRADLMILAQAVDQSIAQEIGKLTPPPDAIPVKRSELLDVLRTFDTPDANLCIRALEARWRLADPSPLATVPTDSEGAE
jgi:hypothetical protein